MEEVRDFRDQMFYREMLRLREDQRLRETRPSNVVSFAQYRRELQHRVQRPADKPTKPTIFNTDLQRRSL